MSSMSISQSSTSPVRKQDHGSNNSRGGSPVKESLPHSPSSSNQMNSQGARLGNKSSSNVTNSPNKLLSSPHKDSSNNLAKSDLNIPRSVESSRNSRSMENLDQRMPTSSINEENDIIIRHETKDPQRRRQKQEYVEQSSHH